MATEPSEYGICRLDLDRSGTHGWQVRLQRKGVRFTRFFSDENWGGRSAALERARQFRDRLLARLDRQGQGQVRSHAVPAARNRSGVVGVARVVNVGVNGIEYASWQASWSPEPGTRRSVRFSVLRYGEDEAFRLACDARVRGVSGDEDTGN